MLIVIPLRDSFLLDSKTSGTVRQKMHTQAVHTSCKSSRYPSAIATPPSISPWHFASLAAQGDKCDAEPADWGSERHAGGHPAEVQGQGTQLPPNNGLRCRCLKCGMRYIHVLYVDRKQTAASNVSDGSKLERSTQKWFMNLLISQNNNEKMPS